ncbi:YesL family protein [Saliterribacillus persicus]|uniref:Putative membrane protein YesL n=1 Tax=Saliterribacillus persicus TaxID=930114 RepID=A0A368Y9E3_9BACI|nr:YesL family protein [Saliterribacillus persicus]RCW76890.1 putative membrane protein YesL [Saliterribacillus persicus]
MNGQMRGFYKVAEWVLNIAYLNILWIAFTLVGIVIFGLFPATTSMFTVIRKWVLGKRDIPIFQTFWSTYKKEIIKSNILGLIVIAVGGLLYLDFSYVSEQEGFFIQLTYYPLIILIVIYILSLLYVFPVYVHYDTKLIHVLKNSVLLMIMSPFITIMLMTGLVFVYFIMEFLPGLTPFFAASLFSYIIMWSCNFAFNKVSRFQKVNQ